MFQGVSVAFKSSVLVSGDVLLLLQPTANNITAPMAMNAIFLILNEFYLE